MKAAHRLNPNNEPIFGFHRSFTLYRFYHYCISFNNGPELRIGLGGYGSVHYS
jgi:hypothetical protein